MISVTALWAAMLLKAQVLVDDPMNNTDRSTQNLPNEVAWFKGGGSAVTLNPTANGMESTSNGNSRLIAANFVNDTAVFSLSVGQALVIEYTFKASSVGNPTFNTDNRFGLFSFADSPSVRWRPTTVRRTANINVCRWIRCLLSPVRFVRGRTVHYQQGRYINDGQYVQFLEL